MDLREPLRGGRNDFDAASPRILARKKSDVPILRMLSPRWTPSSLTTIDPFSTSQFSPFEQSRGGGPEFQVGSVPPRRFLEPISETSATAPSLAASRLASLRRISEESHDRFAEQQPLGSSDEAEEQQQRNSRQGNNNEELDLEAPSSLEESVRYNDDGNDSNRGFFGEPLTDDAQETKEEKDGKYSWKSGLAGLLLSVPLLPSLPDILNPFCTSPEDDLMLDTKYARCDSCNLHHGADEVPAEEVEQKGQTTTKSSGGVREFLYSSLPSLQPVDEEEQNGQTTPKRSGGLKELLFSSIPSIHSLPNLFADPCSEEHSLDCTGARSPRGPVKAVTKNEAGEARYAVADSCSRMTKKKTLRRCRTAPMLTGLPSHTHTKLSDAHAHSTGAGMRTSASSVVWQATLGLCIYLCMGVIVYTWKREEFRGIETVGVVDALYFCIVTMCTIGYGDITPITPSAKILACALVFVGFGFIEALLSGMVNFVLDRQEHLLLTVMEHGHHERAKNVFMDSKKGRMRIRMKVALAIGTVLSAMAVGVIVLHFMEGLPWIDAIYATCISITTVGYGDVSFQTMPGRLFAAVWLLLSTLGVARAFLYLAEARVHSRHRHLAKRVLHKKMTADDLMRMDLDDDGHVSKSEFVVYKLQEMGRIEENDVVEICQQFDFIDNMNAGKITLAQLLEAELEERGKTS